MRRIYKFLFLAGLFVAAHPAFCFAAEGVITGRITKLSVNDGATVVELITEKPHKNYIYKKAFGWGGDVENIPKSIIVSLTVLDNKQNLYIPLSAYADLGTPRRLFLNPTADGEFQLIIEGGDAGGAYKALFDFKNHEITHRKVMSGEFPKDAWEETSYTFNHLDN